MKCYFTPARINIISKNKKYWWRWEKSWNPPYIANGNGKWFICCENSLVATQKLKMKWPYDPAILLLGMYAKDFKSETQANIYTKIFTVVLFTMTKRWKQLIDTPKNNWKNKKFYLHTIKYYLDIKKNEVLTHTTTGIDIKNTMLNERNRHKRSWMRFHLY